MADAAEATLTFAIDRASVRRVDADGRLHIDLTNISKATVNPYYGHEIPGAAELGLDPQTIYQVFRPPEALLEGAASFNNIPLMDDHIIVSADQPQTDRVVGSTGTDAAFEGDFLRNSLVVWNADAIARIESGEQKEISCAYRYIAILKAGIHKGLPYSIVMSNIVGNHVALVKKGRAGPDVVVADSQLGEEPMSKFSVVKGKLAAKFACDTALSTSERVYLMMALDEMEEAATEDEECAEDEAEEEAKTKAADKKAKDEAEEAKAEDAKRARDKAAKDKKARDEESDPPAQAEDEDDDEGKEAAMDSKIKLATDAAIAQYAADRDALDEAKIDVQPYVGQVHGLKSADAVYRFALDSAKVDHKGIAETAALRAMVKMMPKPGTVPADNFAMDSDARASVGELIPGLAAYA